jgi:hypothetical protein
MRTSKRKFILLKQDGETIKCCIKNIVCVISKNGICTIYEYHPALERVIPVESHYRLKWFTDQIDDPHYFTIREGTEFNPRFFRRLRSDRTILLTVPDIPQLVLALDKLSEFREHIKHW